MGLPGVKINVLNGQLGIVGTSEDAVMGLIGCGVSTDDIALNEPKQIFSLADLEALGIDAEYASENNTDIYAQVADFYSKAGNGRELWVMIVSSATLMQNMVDLNGTIATTLIEVANGRLRMIGVTRSPEPSYTATYENGFDDDAYEAVLKAEELVRSYRAMNIPFRVLVEGRDFQGDPTALVNLREGSQNGVGVVLDGLKSESKAAAVGRALGQFANRPVQRNIGRVKDGDINEANAYFSDGSPIEDYSVGQWGAIHDKGYIFLRKFFGRSGYFYNDDPAATLITDDYNALALGRVIDKAQRIAYVTYINELLDDLEINPANGQLNPAVIKSYQARIENAINLSMTNAEEISGVRAVLEPDQNVLSTNKVQVKLFIVPKGYSKEIEVDLGFENPALN